MFSTLDLKSIEQKAFRATYQDGLLDINMGGLVISMAMLAYITASDNEAFPVLRFGFFLLGMIISSLVFWGGKKYLTAPRMGQVRFGPRRQRRNRTLALVLGGIVLLQVLILAGTILAWKNPGWAASLGFSVRDRDLERLVVAIVGSLFVGPSMALIAYFTDFMRGYYIAFIISLAVFSYIWFEQPSYMIIGGLLIIIPGVVLLVRFLRQYPLPPQEMNHE